MVAGGGLGLAAFLIPRSPAAAFAALFVAAVLWAPDAGSIPGHAPYFLSWEFFPPYCFSFHNFP